MQHTENTYLHVSHKQTFYFSTVNIWLLLFLLKQKIKYWLVFVVCYPKVFFYFGRRARLNCGCHSSQIVVGKGTQILTTLIGVFWLCTGNDRLDVILIRGFNIMFCEILRCGTWIHTMDDHCRTFLARTSSSCHVNSCIS